MKCSILALAIAIFSYGCGEESVSLYEDIPTDIVTVSAFSHDAPDFEPVPDSLRLQFNRILRMLLIQVVATGCEPDPEAELDASDSRITVRFDMNNACEHVRAEEFDVAISLSPVHPDRFQLIVSEHDFETDQTKRIVLSQFIDVRSLPGFGDGD